MDHQELGLVSEPRNSASSDTKEVTITVIDFSTDNELKQFPEASDAPAIENGSGNDTATAEKGIDDKKTRKTTLRNKSISLLLGCLGELVGTFMLTLFICSIVAAAVITEAQTGIWQVALPSGLGVALSIFVSAHISDAHLNPAVTLACGLVRFKHFHWSLIAPYILSQLIGSIFAGGFVHLFFNGAVSLYETQKNITRGQPGSELTAMIFGEYFPNPSLYPHTELENFSTVSMFEGFLVETWGTLILVFVIFSVTNKRNSTIGNSTVIIPVTVAFTVACLISIYGPLTQAGLNPARDFGPRIVAAMTGWGNIAIPGPRNGFWIYIFGPLVGGVIGGGLSDLLLLAVDHLRSHKS